MPHFALFDPLLRFGGVDHRKTDPSLPFFDVSLPFGEVGFLSKALKLPIFQKN
jgi:hypothetical protein